MMKYLVLNFRGIKHPHAGGSERSAHIFARNLVDRGDSVTVFCSSFEGLTAEEVFEGVRYVRRGNLYTVYLWACFLYLFKFRKEIDIVLEDVNGIPWFTVFYCFKPKAVLMHHVHQKAFFYQLPWYIAVLAVIAERSLIVFYKRVKFLTVSPSVKKEFVKFGIPEKNIFLTYNGIDDGFKPLKKFRDPTIISVGRVRAYKRLDLQLEVFKKVLEEVKDAKLIVVGDGDDLENVKKAACEKGIDEHVTFTGFVDDSEKKKLLGKSWIYNITSSEEGWGIGVIEANASGCPVVAFTVGGLKDSVRENETGFLVKFGDVNGFSEKVVELIKDEKTRFKMGKKGVKWAKNFTWSKWTDAIEKVLTDEYKKK